MKLHDETTTLMNSYTLDDGRALDSVHSRWYIHDRDMISVDRLHFADGTVEIFIYWLGTRHHYHGRCAESVWATIESDPELILVQVQL